MSGQNSIYFTLHEESHIFDDKTLRWDNWSTSNIFNIDKIKKVSFLTLNPKHYFFTIQEVELERNESCLAVIDVMSLRCDNQRENMKRYRIKIDGQAVQEMQQMQ